MAMPTKVRSFSWGKGGRCVRLTTYHHPVPLSGNLGTSTYWNRLEPSGACNGTAFALSMTDIVMRVVTLCSLMVNFKKFLPVDNVMPNYTTSHPSDSTLIAGDSGMLFCSRHKLICCCCCCGFLSFLSIILVCTVC